MTLILTCLAHDHIVQVADRRLTRLDGTLYNDDTNKAVFYCGRVAVAYTGLAQMEGKPTDEWIGFCMKDEMSIELAMNKVASSAERHLRQLKLSDKRFAAVAAGWATFNGAPPLRPYICVASNFLSEDSKSHLWNWKSAADEAVTVKTKFLDEKLPFVLFVAGQNLTNEENIRINRILKKAIERGGTTTAVVRILGAAVRSVASGTDNRSLRVSKGMIIHLLSREALLAKRSQIVTPLSPNTHSFLYISNAGKTDRFKGAVIACNGMHLTNFRGGTILPGEKGMIRTEMEESARRNPIQVASTDTQYSSPCPFCLLDVQNRRSNHTPNIVTGELPLTDSEAWVHCRGTTGHLVLIQRNDVS